MVLLPSENGILLLHSSLHSHIIVALLLNIFNILQRQSHQHRSCPRATEWTNSSATPRTSGLCTDSRRQQQQGKGRASSGGGAAEGEGNAPGLEGEKGQDQNRHKPKESSIFSPALNQSQEVSNFCSGTTTAMVVCPEGLSGLFRALQTRHKSASVRLQVFWCGVFCANVARRSSQIKFVDQ